MELKQQLIAIERSDGGVSLMTFITVGRGSILPEGAAWAPELGGGTWFRPASDALIRSEITKVMPAEEVVAWRKATADDVPGDRTYRDAWVHKDGQVVHDMTRARGVHRNLLRKHRAPVLRELDARWMRATGQGKTAEADAIEAQRQAWRDAPAAPRIEAAGSVEELKALLPAE